MIRKLKIQDFLEKLLLIIYPKRCIFCDEVMVCESKGNICDKCKVKNQLLISNICNKCGKPLDVGRLNICFDCSGNSQVYEKGRALWVYEGDVKKAIHRYKYHSRREYGKLFADEMYCYYRNQINWPIDLITSVPLHKSRLKERGYNQAGLLAHYLGRKLDKEVNNDLLIRMQNTKPQKDLSDVQRIHNVNGVFSINNKYSCENKNILLIDDIYTTGSTINSIAKVLINHGANKVNYMTLAIGRGL